MEEVSQHQLEIITMITFICEVLSSDLSFEPIKRLCYLEFNVLFLQ